VKQVIIGLVCLIAFCQPVWAYSTEDAESPVGLCDILFDVVSAPLAIMGELSGQGSGDHRYSSACPEPCVPVKCVPPKRSYRTSRYKDCAPDRRVIGNVWRASNCPDCPAPWLASARRAGSRGPGSARAVLKKRSEQKITSPREIIVRVETKRTPKSTREIIVRVDNDLMTGKAKQPVVEVVTSPDKNEPGEAVARLVTKPEQNPPREAIAQVVTKAEQGAPGEAVVNVQTKKLPSSAKESIIRIEIKEVPEPSPPAVKKTPTATKPPKRSKKRYPKRYKGCVPYGGPYWWGPGY
jgi:hypothetical protein